MNHWYHMQFGKVRHPDKFDPARYHPKQELWLQMEKDRENRPNYLQISSSNSRRFGVGLFHQKIKI